MVLLTFVVFHKGTPLDLQRASPDLQKAVYGSQSNPVDLQRASLDFSDP